MTDEGLTRRDFLKHAGKAGAIGAGLAATNWASVIAGTKDFSGVTIEYWDIWNSQSKLMKEFVQEIVNSFEERTGAKVNVNWSSFGPMMGAKWRTAFKAGRAPDIYNAAGWQEGPLRQHSLDLKSFYNESPELYDKVKWILEMEDYSFGQVYPDRRIFLPTFFAPRQTMVGRIDLMEEAGIDTDKHWPPQSMSHWIDLGLRVKDAGVVEYPLWIATGKHDAGDCSIPAWVAAHGEANVSEEGLFINRDWTECNCDKPVWHNVLSTLVDVYRKLELTSPATPNVSDEECHEALTRGSTVIGVAENAAFSTFLDRTPELLKEGKIKFAPWPTMGGISAFEKYMFYHEIVKKNGSNADEKARAAWELGKEWLRPEHQDRLVPLMAALPIDKDLWENEDVVPNKKHNYYSALKEMAEEPASGYTGHPQMPSLTRQTVAEHFQPMFRGEVSVAEGLDNYCKDVNETLKKS